MIKVEVIEDFTLNDFDKIQELERTSVKDIHGYLSKGDTFKCDKGLCDYLMGGNALGKTVVKVLEVEPEKKEVKEEEPAKEGIIEKAEKKILPKAKKKKDKK